MKKYFVAVYPNQNFQVAGMDNNSGGYPTENLGSFRFWTDKKELQEYLKMFNVHKNCTDFNWMEIREFSYSLLR